MIENEKAYEAMLVDGKWELIARRQQIAAGFMDDESLCRQTADHLNAISEYAAFNIFKKFNSRPFETK